MLSEQHRANLKRLADYLIALPEDYEHFNMGLYNHKREKDYPLRMTTFEEATIQTVPECGTIACAIGHCHDAGLPVLPFEASNNAVDWVKTTQQNFGIDIAVAELEKVWDWCFSSNWSYKDDTHQGAAKRIYWFLENGVPVDHLEQMDEEDYPLCYRHGHGYSLYISYFNSINP